MADAVTPHEKQIEQLQPQIEGAPEASSKLAGAGDASTSVKPLESGNENEKLKIATAGREVGGTTEAKINKVGDASIYPDESFVDKQGRPIVVRTQQNGDLFYVRAYDQNVSQPPTDGAGPGQAGRANLQLQHESQDDKVTRVFLQDIQATPSYREVGVGSKMNEAVEHIARQHGAKEIYGNLSYAAEDESAVRTFYQRNGYSFRPGTVGGEEIFKKLS